MSLYAGEGRRGTAPLSGGTIDHSDRSAPKEIRSTELRSVETTFCCECEEREPYGRFLSFRLKKEESGAWTLEETLGYRISAETDERLVNEVQRVIRECDLVRDNGTNRHTAGLPWEFQPCSFRAEYASGEVLYFSYNNDPAAEWSNRLCRLFCGTFRNQGVADPAIDP